MEKTLGAEKEKASMAYRSAVFAVKAIYNVIPNLRLTASGLENLPNDGHFLLAFTHHNSHDIPTIGTVIYEHTNRPVYFMTAEELLPETPKEGLRKYENYLNYELSDELSFLSKHALNAMHAKPIRRQPPIPPSQIKDALRVLKDGHILGVAAEGGRYDGDRVADELKGGAGRLALSTEATIVPVAAAGQNWRRKKGKNSGAARWYIPRSVHVHIGMPINTRRLLISNESDLVDKLIRPVLQMTLQESYRQYKHHNGERAAARLDRST